MKPQSISNGRSRSRDRERRRIFPTFINRFRFVLAIALLAVNLCQWVGCGPTKSRIGKVVGSSMSPGYLGEHYYVSCKHCTYSFACDVDQADRRQHLVCSNCGGKIEHDSCQLRIPDSLEIESNGATIERWDVVAFRMPDHSEKNQSAGIKRIVGMPGETLAIRGGNLYANGIVLRKSIEQQKAVRIPVHDTSFWPENENHWAVAPDSDWRIDKSFIFGPRDPSRVIQWFNFRNQRNYSHPEDGRSTDKSYPFEDYYAFNQSLSRDLNPLDEVFFELDATISRDAILAWRFDHRGTVYEFQIDTNRKEFRVANSDPEFEPMESSLHHIELDDSDYRIEFSSMDLQLLVMINGQEVFRKSLSESKLPVSNQVLAFGAASGEVSLNRIQIWRDLYYFPAQDGATSESFLIDRSGYFVLGDNVPVSVDSRHWLPPTLLETNILGRVKHRPKP